ncbi:MAG: hypothetical protein ACO1SX_28730 [Actinomycetota bacterium]
MQPFQDQERGAEVRALLEAHGFNARSQRARTGINHVTMGNMLNGYAVDMTTVVRFAQGFNLDLNQWLAKFGFPPLQTEPTDYSQTFARRYREMKERLASEGIPTPGKGSNLSGSEGLTPEDAEAEIAELERVLRRLSGK